MVRLYRRGWAKAWASVRWSGLGVSASTLKASSSRSASSSRRRWSVARWTACRRSSGSGSPAGSSRNTNEMRLPLADESSAERTSAGHHDLERAPAASRNVCSAPAQAASTTSFGVTPKARRIVRTSSSERVTRVWWRRPEPWTVQRRRRRRRQHACGRPCAPSRGARGRSRPGAAASRAGRRSRRSGRRSRGRAAGRGSARATGAHSLASPVAGASGSASSSRLPSSTTARPSTMQWCALPTIVGGSPEHPHLPQRAVARQRRGEDLVDDVAVGHVEVARGIEVRVVDPHRVVDAERHVGQLLAVAVGVLHPLRDVARSAPRRWPARRRAGRSSRPSRRASAPAGSPPPGRRRRARTGAQEWNSASRSASSSSARRSAASSLPNGFSAILPFSCRHVPATWPSTRKVGNECGVLMSKIFGRCSSGRTPVRRAWTSSVASQVGRKRSGAGVSGSGSGARGRSTSSAPSSAGSGAARAARASRSTSVGGSPAQLGDVLRPRPGRSRSGSGGRGARPRSSASGRRADPVLGGRVEVGAAALPRARRRHAHQVDPQPDAARPSAGRAAPRSPCGCIGRRSARSRSLRAAPAIACGDGPSRIAVPQCARRASRTASASGQ